MFCPSGPFLAGSLGCAAAGAGAGAKTALIAAACSGVTPSIGSGCRTTGARVGDGVLSLALFLVGLWLVCRYGIGCRPDGPGAGFLPAFAGVNNALMARACSGVSPARASVVESVGARGDVGGVSLSSSALRLPLVRTILNNRSVL